MDPSLSGKPITSIPAGTTGTLTLYAGWQVLFVEEDYDNASLRVVWNESETAAGTVGALNHRVNANRNAVLSTKKDASGNQYLSMLPGGGYPDIRCTGYALSRVLADGKLTFSLEMAKGPGGAPSTTVFRMRSDSGGTSNSVPVFVTSGDNIRLGGTDGAVIATLTEQLTQYNFVVDFNTAMLYAFDADGGQLGECSFTPPAVRGVDTARNWLATLNNWVFNWSITGDPGAMNQEMLIDNIRAISGNLFDH